MLPCSMHGRESLIGSIFEMARSRAGYTKGPDTLCLVAFRGLSRRREAQKTGPAAFTPSVQATCSRVPTAFLSRLANIAAQLISLAIIRIPSPCPGSRTFRPAGLKAASEVFLLSHRERATERVHVYLPEYRVRSTYPSVKDCVFVQTRLVRRSCRL